MGFATNDFYRNQMNLMPLVLEDIIDENSPVRAIEAFVET